MDINATATLIPAEFPTPFRDDAISPEVATALRRCAKRIRRFGEQQTKVILAIGRELIAANGLLPPDQLGSWIRKEFGMRDETANAYMAAGRRIATDQPSQPRELSLR